ncbi:MAG: 6-bladed beta-propeller, partial [Spirochaetia bacterium]|nr:6-bladed beta-propeller [Spirochaetia bacterium]
MSHKSKNIFIFSVTLFLLLILYDHSINAQKIPNFRIKEEAARDSFQKGLAFYNSGRYVAAREFFYDALNIHPYFHLARRYLGDAYYYSGDWNGALDQWTFLDDLSDGVFPLVRQRYELLRFYLNRYKDPGDYVYFKSYDSQTWGQYDITTPVDLFIDQNNILTILSYTDNSMLQVFPSGNIFGNYSGLPFYRPDGPLAMDIKDDLFYLAEYNADRVGIYRKNGIPVMTFGESGNKDGFFRGPSGIRVTDKAIFVSDSGNNRIQKFDLDGKFIFSITGDSGGNPMRNPAGIAVDDDGLLYIADRDGKRILIYDQDGNFISELRSSLLKKPRNIDPGKKRLWIADEESGILYYSFLEKTWGSLNQLDDGKGKYVKFYKPFSIREDQSGIVYVANHTANRIDILTPEGFKTSNLDVKIEKVDSSSYPDMAVFLSVKNRTGMPLPGLPKNSFKLYENDRRIGHIRSDNMRPFNTRMNFVFVYEASPENRKLGKNTITST